MKANISCGGAERHLDVYLNGKKLPDAVEADEEAGYVWTASRGADGRVVPDFLAGPGSFVYGGLQLIRLKGEFRIDIVAPDEGAKEAVRQQCAERFVPIVAEEI